MNKQLFLNVDLSTKSNSSKGGHQVIHVETLPGSFYVIGACFSVKGEHKLDDGRKFYDEITITNLVLRNLTGPKKKIVGARIEYKPGYDYHFVIELADNTGAAIESDYIPNLKFKNCSTNSSFDVTIDDPNMQQVTEEILKMVGPKICQFRTT